MFSCTCRLDFGAAFFFHMEEPPPFWLSDEVEEEEDSDDDEAMDVRICCQVKNRDEEQMGVRELE